VLVRKSAHFIFIPSFFPFNPLAEPNHTMPVQQTLPNIYLDSEKLKDFLMETFGKGNFRIQVRSNDARSMSKG
jgi:hypothetical protein